MWGILIPVTFMFFAGMGAIIRLVEGRRTYRLELKEKEARIAEAKAKELEVAQQRAELEYRQSLLELEGFDRRAGGAPPPPPARDPEQRPDAFDPPQSPTSPE
ncbi:MAG TPA: hypothetical protein VKZ74_02055 [Natronosporangium sp.]|nr:hypothetical protein [Natronosporangium sp.]